MPDGRQRGHSRHRSANALEAVLLKALHEHLDQILKADAVLLRRTDVIERQCKAILIAIAKLQEDSPQAYVTPELESAVKLVERIATTIDEKVPDETKEQ